MGNRREIDLYTLLRQLHIQEGVLEDTGWRLQGGGAFWRATRGDGVCCPWRPSQSLAFTDMLRMEYRGTLT